MVAGYSNLKKCWRKSENNASYTIKEDKMLHPSRIPRSPHPTERKDRLITTSLGVFLWVTVLTGLGMCDELARTQRLPGSAQDGPHMEDRRSGRQFGFRPARNQSGENSWRIPFRVRRGRNRSDRGNSQGENRPFRRRRPKTDFHRRFDTRPSDIGHSRAHPFFSVIQPAKKRKSLYKLFRSSIRDRKANFPMPKSC